MSKHSHETAPTQYIKVGDIQLAYSPRRGARQRPTPKGWVLPYYN